MMNEEAGPVGAPDAQSAGAPADPAGPAPGPAVAPRRRRRGHRGGRRHRRRGAGAAAPAQAPAPAASEEDPPEPAASPPSGTRRRKRKAARPAEAPTPAASEEDPPGPAASPPSGTRRRKRKAARPAEAPTPDPPAEEAPPPEPARRSRRRRRSAARPKDEAEDSSGRRAGAKAVADPERNVQELALALGITVREVRWYRQALYHASYVNERARPGISSNERLEFLGDAVLDLAVGQYLFERYPDMTEGDLSRLRSAVVRATTLAARGKVLGLGRFALLGKGEERSGGRRRPNFLADLFEALIGAIFLDQGIGAATEFVLTALRPDLEAAAEGYEHANYKAKLQDAVQKDNRLPVTYTVLSSEGPEHARIWQCEVRIGGRRCGVGQGRTKRAAEQEAAREALLRGWSHGAAR